MVTVWAAVGMVVGLFSGTQLEARWRLRGMTPHPTVISKSEMVQLLGTAVVAVIVILAAAVCVAPVMMSIRSVRCFMYRNDQDFFHDT